VKADQGATRDAHEPLTLPGRVFDPSVPHAARVYDCWLGGKDHYPADRAVAEAVARYRPQAAASARANRAFGCRAVTYLTAGCGIRQFLDIGTGLPAPGATHQVAQAIDPSARAAYVDNDPLVLAYARALLTSTPQGRCGYIDADLRDTTGLLAQASATLDLTQPVAVLLLAVLHYLPDAGHPARIVRSLAAALAPGSYLAISHLTADLAPAEVTAAVHAYNGTVPAPVTPRSHAEVTALFTGLPWSPRASSRSPNGAPTARPPPPPTFTPASPAPAQHPPARPASA